jgi:mRNA-degrading endonuclease HigB of HigAB toxin-antitoxin module
LGHRCILVLSAFSQVNPPSPPYQGGSKGEKCDRISSLARKAQWQNLEDVRKIYRDAEAVGNFTVFNIKGNDYRLIVGIDYENQTVYYKYFLTHAEYDKGKWKNDPYF